MKKEINNEQKIKELEYKIARLRDSKNPMFTATGVEDSKQNKVSLDTTLDKVKGLRRNPLILGSSSLDLTDTLNNANHVLTYLSCVADDDQDYSVTNYARFLITNCALDAITYVESKIKVKR